VRSRLVTVGGATESDGRCFGTDAVTACEQGERRPPWLPGSASFRIESRCGVREASCRLRSVNITRSSETRTIRHSWHHVYANSGR